MYIFPMKRYAHPVIVGLIFVTAIMMLSHCTAQSNVTETAAQNHPVTPFASENTIERMIYPAGFITFQNYLDVIGGKPGQADPVLIEATVLSITSSEVCPYPEEKCSLQPYPRDWGVIRVDKIVDILGSQTSITATTAEGAGSNLEKAEGATAEQSGVELSKKRGNYGPLLIGQEVETLFVLTVKPVKVVYEPLMMQTTIAGLESSNQFSNSSASQTVQQEIQTLARVFEPLPLEEGKYVFTVEIGQRQERVERFLPGLAVGSKFQAKAQYNGVLYIQEYTVIQ